MTDTGQLAARVRGPVLRPDDPGYDEERAGFQTAQRHRPEVIVGATGADDVRAAVTFAADRGMGVAVQATGHGMPAAAEGGVLVSTRRMDGFRVDAATGTARLDAGVRWAPVLDAAGAHGLAPLSGSAPHTGAVSYTLGGGVGLLARMCGFAADHVRTVDVVTADGELRHVTAETEPELFWGLRGGRNLGVVTGVEVDLMPVASLYGGALYFGAEYAAEVWQAYREWTVTGPELLTSSIALIPFPDVDGVPGPFRGRHVTHVRVAYAGAASWGERLVAPLRDVAPRLVDTVAEMPYSESGKIHDERPQPMAYHASHTLLRELDAGAVKALLDQVGPGAPDSAIIEVRHLGGALGRAPAVANAVGNRDARYFAAVLSPTADAAAIRPLHDRVLRSLEPWSTGGKLLNFLYGENASPANVRAAFDADAYARLAALTASIDPDDMFRLAHRIAPAA